MISDVSHFNDIKIYILGGGAIVSECHLPALKVLKLIPNVAVIEPNLYNRTIIKNLFPDCSIIESDYVEFFKSHYNKNPIEAAIIALPNSFHFDASFLCLERGIPVLCEKPLALTTNQYAKLIEKTKQTGISLYVAMARRFMPSLTILRRIINSNILGNIKAITLEHGGNVASWPWDTETVLRKDQGGCLINLGIHFIDYLQYIFGDLKPKSYTDDFSGGIEVNCHLSLLTESSIPVDIKISWTHSLKNILRIEGDKYDAIMDLNNFGSIKIENAKLDLHGTISSTNVFESGDWKYSFESCFVEQAWFFLNSIINKDRKCDALVSPVTALISHKIIEWAYSNHSNFWVQASDTLIVPADSRPTLSPSHVVVTGGTGFVGSHLVGRLSALNMKSITIPVRHFSSGSQIARFPANMVRVDLLDLESCRKTLKGQQYLFHLAYGNSGANASNITIIGTKNILKAALLEGLESVVVFGTCSVWSGYENCVVDETFKLKPNFGDYAKSKSTMHKETIEFALKHPDIRVSIVCPGAVYGPRGNLFVKMPIESAKQGKFTWFENGTGNCNYVYVDNLVDAAILSLVKNEARGKDFIAVDGNTSWASFLGPLVGCLNKEIISLSNADIKKIVIANKSNIRLIDLVRIFVNLTETKEYLASFWLLSFLKTKILQDRSILKSLIKGKVVKENPVIKLISNNTNVPDLWMRDVFGPCGPVFSSKKLQTLLGWKPCVSLEQGLEISKNWYFETHG